MQSSRGVTVERCSEKYALSLQQNTHAEVWLIKIMIQYGCCPVKRAAYFSEHFFIT